MLLDNSFLNHIRFEKSTLKSRKKRCVPILFLTSLFEYVAHGKYLVNYKIDRSKATPMRSHVFVSVDFCLLFSMVLNSFSTQL